MDQSEGEIPSVCGPLRPILVPVSIGFDDPKEVGRALIARKYDLTRIEVEILELLTRLENNDIATELGLGEKTVSNHVSEIFRKMVVHKRTQAAVIAAQYGLGDQKTTVDRPRRLKSNSKR